MERARARARLGMDGACVMPLMEFILTDMARTFGRHEKFSSGTWVEGAEVRGGVRRSSYSSSTTHRKPYDCLALQYNGRQRSFTARGGHDGPAQI